MSIMTTIRITTMTALPVRMTKMTTNDNFTTIKMTIMTTVRIKNDNDDENRV